MTRTNKPTAVFWIIGIVALIWNIFGVGAYLAQAFMTDEVKAALPQADQDMYATMPAWVTAAFAIAVFAGFLGCVALLMRKSWAIALFGMSLIGVLAQQVYNFFIQEYIEISGFSIIGPIAIVIISFFLLYYARAMKFKGVLS